MRYATDKPIISSTEALNIALNEINENSSQVLELEYVTETLDRIKCEIKEDARIDRLFVTKIIISIMQKDIGVMPEVDRLAEKIVNKLIDIGVMNDEQMC